MNTLPRWLAGSAVALLAGCSFMAVQTTPAKVASTTRSAQSLKADELFWATLHGGDYEKIPAVLTALTAAYLENPSDALTAAHVGFTHIWRLAERARLPATPPTITDDAILARRYFEEAYRLDPSDARILGFAASITVSEGSIHRDEKLTRRGYFMLKDSIDAWPEFNLFTAGYTMSGQPAVSTGFAEALDWQWRNLDVCVNEKVDRRNPDFARYMSQSTTTGVKRVCWNSWIAPHNFEGFFMNMGDMLVKAGDWQTARIVYANARLSPDYDSWKFRVVLEERISDAPANVARFNVESRPGAPAANPIMLNSKFACMACHQQ